MIAVILAALGLIFSSLFYKTAAGWWQKEETVRSMAQAFAEEILEQRQVSMYDWHTFCQQLGRIGDYRAELVVYEKKRFENTNGRFYLFSQWEPVEDSVLTEGSYVRLVVTEEEKSTLGLFWLGAGGVFFVGGSFS